MSLEIDRRDDLVKMHRVLRKLNERRLQIAKCNSQSESNRVLIDMYENSVKWHKTQTAWFRNVNMPIAWL